MQLNSHNDETPGEENARRKNQHIKLNVTNNGCCFCQTN